VPGAPVDVSVVIPTFDRCALLPRALSSVAAQSRPACEVIVVDDGSNDDTWKVVRGRSRQIRYLRQEHSGVSTARNRGVAAAGCRWIAFLDSDDEWLPEKLERQMDALARQPGLQICHSDEIWIRDGRRVNARRHHRKHGGRVFEHCLPRCAISPSSVLLERTLLQQSGGFDEALPACEDYDLWLRLCARHPVLLVGDPLIVKYGGHADQLSRRYRALDRFRIYALEKILGDVDLKESDRTAVCDALLRKIDIYLGGVEKRQRRSEVDLLRARRAELRRGRARALDAEGLAKAARTLLAAIPDRPRA
jgi:glycosyltransferase involved in cell wall biosynthesis